MAKEVYLGKFLDIMDVIKVDDEVLSALSEMTFDVLPHNSDYIHDQDVVDNLPHFKKDSNGKSVKDDSKLPQYYYINLMCNSRDKRFKNVVIQVRNKDNIFEHLEVDDEIKIMFDDSVNHIDEYQGKVKLGFWVTTVDVIDDND